MSSTSPQPTSPAPSIESLAPPLTETKVNNAGAAAQQPQLAEPIPPVKDEPWVPVQQPESETTDAEIIDAGKISVIETAKENGEDQSPTLFSRVMKQRAALPQTAHVQKDNTLAIFITLCMVVMAIACGIYFVADRETQVQERIAQVPPAGFTAAPVNTVPAVVPKPMRQKEPNPLFGKPASNINKISAPPVVRALSGSQKARQVTQESETQLSQMQYIEAEYSARRAAELAPASSGAWLALGRALYCQGRYIEAKQAFETCMKHGTQSSKTAKLAAGFISAMPGQTR